MTDLTAAILAAVDWYEAHAGKLPEDVGIKMRDKREPGRRRKEQAELRLSMIIRRMFRRQKARVQAQLEAQHPGRKALATLDNIDISDDEAMAELIAEIIIATRDGVNLFDEGMNLTLDYTVTNTEAAEWARKYAYDLVKDIDAKTVDALQQAISAFVETPGMTIGQVMDMLPFDEQRAQRVATTEITRAYAQGQQMAGNELAKEYPDVKVKKRWFTTQQDIVCELCRPLDGMEVDIDENFYEPDNEYQDGNPPRHVGCMCWLSEYTDIEAE
jgi:hypothetical protein